MDTVSARTAEAPQRLLHWLAWFSALALVTIALLQVRGIISAAHVVLAYLVLVLGATARGGRALGLSLAVLAFACFNFFFVPPYHTFAVANTLDWLVLGAFLVTSAIAAQLLVQAQDQAREARLRAADVDRLAALGAEALNAARAEDALAAVAKVMQDAIDVQRCEIHLRNAAGDVVLAGSSGDPVLHAPAQSTAEMRAMGLPLDTRLVAWVAQTGRAAARCTDGSLRFSERDDGDEDVPAVFEPSDAAALLLPLTVGERTVGVLVLEHGRAIAFDARRKRLLTALSYYAALAADRVRLSAEAEHVEALREADRLKDALLTSVSHDLRTPLTTIKGLAHAISAQGDERAATIEEEADRLNRLVGDLLDLSRLASGAFTARPTINAAEDLLGVALQRVAGTLGTRTIDVSLDTSEPLLLGRFDLPQALRVLVNLIENAVKYSSADSTIEVTARRGGDAQEFLDFTVADRGAGVAAAERDRIFEPFYRPSGSAPDAGSAGLGLSIARGLAEAQGGSVRYEPRAGGGSCFTLRVPAAELADLEGPASSL